MAFSLVTKQISSLGLSSGVARKSGQNSQYSNGDLAMDTRSRPRPGLVVGPIYKVVVFDH